MLQILYKLLFISVYLYCYISIPEVKCYNDSDVVEIPSLQGVLPDTVEKWEESFPEPVTKSPNIVTASYYDLSFTSNYSSSDLGNFTKMPQTSSHTISNDNFTHLLLIRALNYHSFDLSPCLGYPIKPNTVLTFEEYIKRYIFTILC